MPNTLSYPIFQQQWVDEQGRVSRPWQQWLIELWRRVGSAKAPLLNELSAAIEAEYLVAIASPALTHERLVADSDTVTWDFSVEGQAQAEVNLEGLLALVYAGFLSSPTIEVVVDGAEATWQQIALSRVVATGTTRVIQDTYAVVVPEYFRVNGALTLEGDAALHVL